MKKSVEILGLPIISITEGRELGTSKTLLIDAKNGVVAAITIEDDDWYRGVKLIPYESVIAIGEDAVTITHSDNILNLEEAGDYERFLNENIRVIGTKAITKSGRIQGKVTEVFIGEGGKIVKVEITTPEGSTNEVTSDQISIFGKQVTVVDADAEKKNNFVTSAPAFSPTVETSSAENFDAPAEIPQDNFAAPQDNFDVTQETFDAQTQNFDAPANFPTETPDAPPEVEQTNTDDIFNETPEEAQAALEDIMTPEPEVATEVEAEVNDDPFTPFTEETTAPTLEVEEQPADTPTLSDIPVVDEMPTFDEQPAEDKLAAMTKQAEDLKSALQKAMGTDDKSAQKSSREKAVDERRRRVLLGKHATKTIMADSGTIVVEAGAEVTEEVLQRARLSNKFIELSMNVQ